MGGGELKKDRAQETLGEYRGCREGGGKASKCVNWRGNPYGILWKSTSLYPGEKSPRNSKATPHMRLGPWSLTLEKKNQKKCI